MSSQPASFLRHKETATAPPQLKREVSKLPMRPSIGHEMSLVSAFSRGGMPYDANVPALSFSLRHWLITSHSTCAGQRLLQVGVLGNDCF